MKYLLIGLMFFGQSVLAVDKVDLTFGYKPSSKYLIEQLTSSNLTMDFSGDTSALSNDFKAQLPMSMKMKKEGVHVIETGAPKDDGTYSLSMLIEKDKTLASVNGSDFFEQPKSDNELQGLTIKGSAGPAGQLVFESITGKNVSTELKSMMKSMFEQLANANIMAGKTVGMGETVPIKMPISIPVGNMGAVNFEMEMRYTLNGIAQNIANFKVDFDAVVTSDLKEANIDIIGAGTGFMTYDINEKIAPVMDTDMTMNLSVPMKGGMFKVSSTNTSVIHTKIADSLTSKARGTQ